MLIDRWDPQKYGICLVDYMENIHLLISLDRRVFSLAVYALPLINNRMPL